jgi:hypothetical protein
MRQDAELALVHFETNAIINAVADRPRGRPAHRLMGEFLAQRTVKVGAVKDQLSKTPVWLFLT